MVDINAKLLDDAFNEMDVAYFRYQDDILILCQTKCSLNRCKQRLMQVLQERRLRLSGKKTRIGSIDKGFHFLGIQYPKTQPLDNTTMTQAVVNVSNTE
ncbi:TPA: reverse transcriptase domain-containing protein [Legionella pneumophila]|nr:reverse transcriptase domain-containing protein [Legionella pneumophila]MDW9165864.1 reverse transcriptase domain-containing protein [Legionella pneumophila]